MKRLTEIQQKLHVKKVRVNQHGKFNYRSLEDIMSEVKPLLGEATLTLTDEVVAVGDRIFLRATVTLTEGNQSVSACGWAQHAESQKGMQEAQLSGSTSSYARKYALGGLFLIDDSIDPDTIDALDASDIKDARKAAGLSLEEVIVIANKSPFNANGALTNVSRSRLPLLLHHIRERGKSTPNAKTFQPKADIAVTSDGVTLRPAETTQETNN